MADEKKHANDEYINPGSRTAAAPIPPEVFPEKLAEEKAEAKDNAEVADEPREPAARRQADREKASK